MRKSIGAAVGAVAVLAVVLVVALTGLVLPSVAGTAQPNEATRTLKDLNAAAIALADAPGARYNGIITVGGSSGSYKITLTDLTVTAAGDVRGTLQIGSRAEIEWLQLGDQTFIKGPESFWNGEQAAKQPPGVKIETPGADEWTAVKESMLGIDLRAALRPSRLALNLSQQDTALGTGELNGTPVGNRGETPDRRVNTGQDPIGVSELPVEESDGGVDGARRFQVGGTISGVDENGDIVAVRGLIGKGFGGDASQIDVDLKVQKVDLAEVRSTYSTIKSDIGGTIRAWDVTVSNPSGDLNCTNGGACVIGYDIGAQTPQLTGGSVTIIMTTVFKKGGNEFGKCEDTLTTPINGRGHIQCSVPFGAPADVNSESKFRVTVNGEWAASEIERAVSQGTSVAETSGGWAPSPPKASPAVREYNRRIAIAPSNYVYKIGDVAFDGRERDGTLLIVNGPGYDEHVNPDGALDDGWAGTEQLLSLARDARSAAGDKPVRMVFAEARAADAMRTLLGAENVENIEVVAAPN